MESLLPETLGVVPAGLLIIAAFFTSALTATAGVGGGLLLLALMTYAVPVAVLIPVHGLVQLGSNSSRAWLQRDHIDWPIATKFFIGSIFAGIAGVFLVVQMPEMLLQLILGGFILVMVWIKIPAIKNPPAYAVVIGGAITTFTSFFAGATGPLVAVFLNNMFDEHRRLVATHGITMVIKHLFKLIVFGIAGFSFFEWIPFVAASIISGYLGTRLGTHMMDSIPEHALKLLFKISLTLVALDLLRLGLDLI